LFGTVTANTFTVPTGSQYSTECNRKGRYHINIQVDAGKVTFKDDKCDDLELLSGLGDKPFFIYLGADQDHPGEDKRSRWFGLTVERAPINKHTAHSIVLADDEFTTKRKDLWVYPDLRKTPQYKFTYLNGYLTFAGDGQGASSLRLKKSFKSGITISADLTKSHACSSHWVALSTTKDFHWSWGGSEGQVKFAWNCDDKYIYLPGQRAVSEPCGATGKYHIEIKIANGVMTFEDSKCHTLHAKLPWSEAQEFYVYMGADQDHAGEMSLYDNFKVTGLEQPPPQGAGVALYDNFDYHDEIYDAMWTMVGPSGAVEPWVTGIADAYCGSVPSAHDEGKNSLRFFNDGLRLATTKSLDCSGGCTISFDIRFGAPGNTQCMPMSDPNDGVELQYSLDREIWTTFETFTAKKFGQKFLSWTHVRSKIDMVHSPRAMKRSVYIRWVQIDKFARACCNHWALDNVKVAGKEPVPQPILQDGAQMEEVFDTKEYGMNPWFWDMLKTDVRTSKQVKAPNGGDSLVFNGKTGQKRVAETAFFDLTKEDKPSENLDPALESEMATLSKNEDILKNEEKNVRDALDVIRDAGQKLEEAKDSNDKSAIEIHQKKLQDAQNQKDEAEKRVVEARNAVDANKEKLATDKKAKKSNHNGAVIAISFRFSPDATSKTRAIVDASTGGTSWTTLNQFSGGNNQFKSWTRKLININDENFPHLLTNNTRVRVREEHKNGPFAFRPNKELFAVSELDVLTGASIIGFEDEFTTTDTSAKGWCYQEAASLAPYEYEYSSNERGFKGVYFTGTASGKGTMRTHQSYQAPMKLDMSLLKDAECSNHFIVVSTERYYDWNWENEPETFKFAWDCDKRCIVSPTETKCTPSDYQGLMDVKIEITDNNEVTFSDGHSSVLTLAESIGTKDFFVYIGAAQGDSPSQVEALNKAHADKAGLKVEKNADDEIGPEVSEEEADNLMASGASGASASTGATGANTEVSNGAESESATGAAPAEVEEAPKAAEDEQSFLDMGDDTEAKSWFKSVRLSGRGSVKHVHDGSRKCPQRIDCAVSAWSPWGKCSKNCNTGVSIRTREIVRRPKHGGAVCPNLKEERKCNMRKCDCAVSPWGKFGNCDKPCGGGEQSRFRKITRKRRESTPGKGDGMACPALEDTRSCNEERCAVLGLPNLGRTEMFLRKTPMELFTEKSTDFCYQSKKELAPYSYGYGAAERSIWFRGSSQGKGTIRVHKSVQATEDLEIEARVSKNSKCSNQYIVVSPEVYFRFNSEPEPDTYKFMFACEKKVLIGPKGASEAKCDMLQNYNWQIKFKSGKVSFADDACQNLTLSMNVRDKPYFIYIGSDNAGDVIEDANGKAGVAKNASEIRDVPAQENATTLEKGARVLPQMQAQNENANETFFLEMDAVDSSVSKFLSLRISGEGSIKNIFDDKHKCPAETDCKVTPWEGWGACSLVCGGGTQERRRSITVHPKHGGKECPSLNETRSCNERSCDCGVSAWTNYSNCSKPCDIGLQTRTRTITRVPLADGLACGPLNETRQCNTQRCADIGLPDLNHTDNNLEPIIGNLEKYEFRMKDPNEWCYEAPERLLPFKYKYEANNVKFSGDATGKFSMRSRHSFQLPLRADFTIMRDYECANHWMMFSAEKYGLWTQETDVGAIKLGWNCNSKFIVSPSKNVSVDCPLRSKPLVRGDVTINRGQVIFKDSMCEDLTLNLRPEEPGTDVFAYIGASTKPKGPGGEPYEAIWRAFVLSGKGAEVNKFNSTHKCPSMKDCEVSAWQEWSNCTVPCGGGNRTRLRVVTKQAEYGGEECPALTQTQTCNDKHCGRDCVVTDWSPWGECDKVCGGGRRKRTRSVFKPAIKGVLAGRDCPPLVDTNKTCNTQKCGKDCIVGEWTPWTKCSVPCGGGFKARYRTVLQPAVRGSHAGKPCPKLAEREQCNREVCKAPEGATPDYSPHTECMAMSGKCGACTANPKCGYCPTTGACFAGDATGPTPTWIREPESTGDSQKLFQYVTNCSAWNYAYCIDQPCNTYASCSSCLADSFCGWCAGTGKCMEGDTAGSVGEWCPRAWIHSPLHSGVGVRARSDALLTPIQIQKQQHHLKDFCDANDQQARNVIQEKMETEAHRQRRLRDLRESCAPCYGKWPTCDCGGNDQLERIMSLRNSMVVRKPMKDEAVEVDPAQAAYQRAQEEMKKKMDAQLLEQKRQEESDKKKDEEEQKAMARDAEAKAKEEEEEKARLQEENDKKEAKQREEAKKKAEMEALAARKAMEAAEEQMKRDKSKAAEEQMKVMEKRDEESQKKEAQAKLDAERAARKAEEAQKKTELLQKQQEETVKSLMDRPAATGATGPSEAEKMFAKLETKIERVAKLASKPNVPAGFHLVKYGEECENCTAGSLSEKNRKLAKAVMKPGADVGKIAKQLLKNERTAKKELREKEQADVETREASAKAVAADMAKRLEKAKATLMSTQQQKEKVAKRNAETDVQEKNHERDEEIKDLSSSKVDADVSDFQVAQEKDRVDQLKQQILDEQKQAKDSVEEQGLGAEKLDMAKNEGNDEEIRVQAGRIDSAKKLEKAALQNMDSDKIKLAAAEKNLEDNEDQREKKYRAAKNQASEVLKAQQEALDKSKEKAEEASDQHASLNSKEGLGGEESPSDRFLRRR
jgi:hypothetical protein